VPTAWLPAPGALVRVLAALDISSTHRILLLGSGEGYSAALLAARHGGTGITTVGSDRRAVELARSRLAAAGMRTLIGDPQLGIQGERFDRIISTTLQPAVPRPWLRQAMPGCRIVLPLSTGFEGRALAWLTASGTGGAYGRLSNIDPGIPAEARNLRAMAMIRRASVRYDGALRKSALRPDQLRGNDVRAVLGLLLPDLVAWPVPVDRQPGLFVGSRSRSSWARVCADGWVREGGPGRLWDSVEQAYKLWRDAGSPTPADLTISITPDGRQTVSAPSGQLTARLPLR